MHLTTRAGASAPVGDDVTLGDTVDVPGNMYGTIRFIGTVQGKKGIFAGVELHPEFASRGKNSGDVDGYVVPAMALARSLLSLLTRRLQCILLWH